MFCAYPFENAVLPRLWTPVKRGTLLRSAKENILDCWFPCVFHGNRYGWAAVHICGDSECQQPGLAEITQTNNGCVITKQHPVRMQDAAHGTAELEVSMPDYYQIFTEALAYDDPQGYVSTVLDSGNYPVVSRTATAQVTVQDGQEVVHTDEAIMALLDRELTNVIGEIMEEEP